PLRGKPCGPQPHPPRAQGRTGAATVKQPTAITAPRPAGPAMLSLLLILSGLGRLTAGPHLETSLLQITVPRKIETNTSDGEILETQVIKKSLFLKINVLLLLD
ncbi:unnamed protein product, partial [Gulo gulo]